MHKHITDLENMLAAQKYEHDECMDVDLSQLSRDTGVIDYTVPDKSDDKFTTQDWFWIAYLAGFAVLVCYLGYKLYSIF